jgi:hypothetical protein
MILLNEYLINKHTKSKLYPCDIILDAIKKYQERTGEKNCSLYVYMWIGKWYFTQKTKNGLQKYSIQYIWHDSESNQFEITGAPVDSLSSEITIPFDETIEIDENTIKRLLRKINNRG